MNQDYLLHILGSLSTIVLPVALAVGSHNVLRLALARKVFSVAASRWLYFSMAFIFTPLHEVSHLIVAVIFRHKIDRVSLFQMNSSGTLGYVSHSWNSKNPYQNVGTFFIAIAPLISAIGVTYAVLENMGVDASELDLNISTLKYVAAKMELWQVVLLSLVGFYCTPSNEDFRNSLKGALYIGVIIFFYALVTKNTAYGLGWIASISSFCTVVTGIICILSSLFWLLLFFISLVFENKGHGYGNNH